MQTNAGFLGLHSWLGVFLVAFAAFMFVGIIVVGSILVRAKEASDREKRAEMRKKLEQGKS